MRFFSKLFFAAPTSFFSFEVTWHAAVASFSRLFRNEVLAAPTSYLSAALALKSEPSSIADVAKKRGLWRDQALGQRQVGGKQPCRRVTVVGIGDQQQPGRAAVHDG